MARAATATSIVVEDWNDAVDAVNTKKNATRIMRPLDHASSVVGWLVPPEFLWRAGAVPGGADGDALQDHRRHKDRPAETLSFRCVESRDLHDLVALHGVERTSAVAACRCGGSDEGVARGCGDVCRRRPADAAAMAQGRRAAQARRASVHAADIRRARLVDRGRDAG